MSTPSRPTSPIGASGPIEGAPVRAVSSLVVAATVVTVVSGLWLTFAYRPGELRWLRTLHSGAAGVAVISFVAARVVARGGRLSMSLRRAGAVFGLIIVIGGAFATGSMMAWQGGDGSARGVFVGSGHGLTVDGRLVSPGELVGSFVAHLVLSACLVALAWWRYGRKRCPPRPAAPPPPPGELDRLGP